MAVMPCRVTSSRIPPGRFLVSTKANWIWPSFTSNLPVNRTDCSARRASTPPFAATFFATNSSTVSCGLPCARTAEAVRAQAIQTMVSLEYIIERVNDSVRPSHTQCPCQSEARVASTSHLMTYLSPLSVILENRVPRAGFFDSDLGHPRRKNVHPASHDFSRVQHSRANQRHKL